MKIRFLSAVIFSLAASTALSLPALAQEDPGHPRVNQVENRLHGQEANTERAEDRGNLTQGQAARDEKRDQHIQNQINRDEAKHDGHLTKGEQRKINREENKERREKRKQERKDHREHREHHEMHHDGQ